MRTIAGNIKGIVIEISGDTQKLNKALEDVNKKSKDIQGELKQVERLLKLNPKDTEMLAQKQKLLADAVSNSKEKLDRLRAAQEQVNDQFKKGEINEEQYRAFQRELTKSEQELKKFEAELKNSGMTAEQFGKKLQDAGQKMTNVGKTMSMAVTAPLTAAGVASFKFAADLQDAMGASEQIFKDASNNIKSWANGLDSYYGIAETEAITYANTMGAMLQNIGGLSESEASKMSAKLVELAGDLTAMFGGTTESAVQALTGALKGNNSMLDNYGMGVNDATIKTKALEMGLYDGTGQMDLATKQAATLALIMEQTADAQGQAAREAEGASGSMRSMQTELKNVATDIGEVLLPIITPLIAGLRDLVKRFGEMSPEAQKVVIVIAGIVAAIGPLLLAVGTVVAGFGSVVGAFASVSGAITTILPKIASLVLGLGPIGLLIAAIVAAGVALYMNWDVIKEKAQELWTKVTEVWGGIKLKTDEVWNGIAVALTGIWDGFNAKVTEVFGAIGSFIDEKWTAIKTVTETIWNGLKSLLIETWDALNTKVSEIWQAISTFIDEKWNAVKTVTETIWNGLKTFTFQIWDDLKAKVDAIFEAIRSFIDEKWTAVKSKTDEIWDGIRSFTFQIWGDLKGKVDEIFEAIRFFIDEKWSAIKTKTEEVWNGLNELLTGIWDGFKTKVNTVWDDIWTKISGIWDSVKQKTEEIWDGIKTYIGTKLGEILTAISNKAEDFYNAGKMVFEKFWNGLKRVWLDLKTWIRDTVEWIKGKLQIWSDAKVSMGGSSISGFASGGRVPLTGSYLVGELGPEIVTLPAGALVTPNRKIGGFGNIDYDRLGQAVAKYIKPAVTLQSNIYSPEPLSPALVKRKNEQLLRNLALEWGV